MSDKSASPAQISDKQFYAEPPRVEGKHRFMAGTCVDCGHPLDGICSANLGREPVEAPKDGADRVKRIKEIRNERGCTLKQALAIEIAERAPVEAVSTTPKLDYEIRNIGGNCPVQAEGKVDGNHFYFRARGTHWSFGVGVDEDDAVDGKLFEHYQEYSDEEFAAGWMEESEARAFIAEAVEIYRKSKVSTPLPQQVCTCEGEFPIHCGPECDCTIHHGDSIEIIRPSADASAEQWKSFAFTLEEKLNAPAALPQQEPNPESLSPDFDTWDTDPPALPQQEHIETGCTCSRGFANKSCTIHTPPALPQQEEPATVKYLAPGDSEPVWLLVFEDADRGNATYHSEAEGREAYARASVNWNCTLFAPVPIAPLLGQDEPELPSLAKKGRGEDWAKYWGRAFDERTKQLTQALTSLAATEADRLVCIDKNRQLVDNCRKLDKLVDDACDAGEAVQAKLELAEASLAEAQKRVKELEKELARYKEEPCPKNRNGHFFSAAGVCDYCNKYDEENNLRLGGRR